MRFLRLRGNSESGQSLVETAIVLPFLLILAFNTINFGYFFFVAINLASAPRQGVQYSILGFNTPASLSLPPASAVSTLSYADLGGALPSASTTPMQVCSILLGLNDIGKTTQTAKCTTFGGTSTFSTPAPDPESPIFVLNRVDVNYTVVPLIKAAPFGLVLTPSLNFHRQVSMRVIP